MDAATSQTEHDATQALITALNNLSQADVQAALTAQGYTVARAPNLDNLDVAVSTRNSVVPLAAAVDQAEHDATQVGIGLNLAAIASLDDFIQGGREIDFVGDDAAGWQRVERDVGGTILRRYDLFDELDVRINETVASFIGRQGMISRETISP